MLATTSLTLESLTELLVVEVHCGQCRCQDLKIERFMENICCLFNQTQSAVELPIIHFIAFQSVSKGHDLKNVSKLSVPQFITAATVND